MNKLEKLKLIVLSVLGTLLTLFVLNHLFLLFLGFYVLGFVYTRKLIANNPIGTKRDISFEIIIMALVWPIYLPIAYFEIDCQGKEIKANIKKIFCCFAGFKYKPKVKFNWPIQFIEPDNQ